MNIKQHIEAGHYSKDSAGRALVPMKNGDTATILATDLPDDQPIAAWDGDSLERWHADGIYSREGSSGLLDLLPPPPRKVEVKAYALIDPNGDIAKISKYSGDCGAWSPRHPQHEGWKHLTLTGSYEEPWS